MTKLLTGIYIIGEAVIGELTHMGNYVIFVVLELLLWLITGELVIGIFGAGLYTILIMLYSAIKNVIINKDYINSVEVIGIRNNRVVFYRRRIGE